MNIKTAVFILIPFLITASLSCRTSRPPAISIICIGDGFGGGDCVTNAGEKKYLKPSELKNFWMTTEVDQQNFASWCYSTSVEDTSKAMEAMRSSIISK